MLAPMDRLREAIISDVREDMAAIDELSKWHEELVAAWNEVAATEQARSVNIQPITDDDLG